jgi:threonine aldolase
MRPIDLRSDTVTQPTDAMRAVMARAPVGDDQYGDDPTVNALEERIADLLGKESAVFVPTGTMANQIALRVLTRPGDEVIVSRESHAAWHELGGAGANAGVQLHEIGAGGRFSAEEFRSSVKPRGHAVFPPTALVEIENTHNRAGGIIIPQAEVTAICEAATELGISTFLDGARLFNAAVATGLDLSTLAAPFDLTTVALSKGLGCPVGSVLAGSLGLMVSARRHRRMLGGGMRQVGILAAAGLFALDHHIDRMVEDHANARLIADVLAQLPNVDLPLETVQTNIIIIRFLGAASSVPRIVRESARRGVLISDFGGTKLRITTHLDVSEADCRRAADVVADVLSRSDSI